MFAVQSMWHKPEFKADSHNFASANDSKNNNVDTSLNLLEKVGHIFLKNTYFSNL